MSTKILRLASLLFLSGALLTTTSACGNEEAAAQPEIVKYHFEVKASVNDSSGNGIPKVPVKIDGKTVGYTDKEGQFSAILEELPGTLVNLSVGKLEGLTYAGKTEVSSQMAIEKGPNDEPVPRPLILKVAADTNTVDYLVWVQLSCGDGLQASHCADLPIKVGKETIGNTDLHGHAHFSGASTPKEKITVTIDTNGVDGVKLSPENPTFTFPVGEKAEVYIIKEKFTVGASGESDNDPGTSKKKSSKKRVKISSKKKKRTSSSKKKRKSIVKVRKKKKKKKKKAKAGEIDLW